METIDEIEARATAATPGPWIWRGNVDVHRIELQSQAPRRYTVMCFKRWGMRDAKPVFRDAEERGLLDFETEKQVVFQVCPDCIERADKRVYRGDFFALRSPDAEFIAHARQDVDTLLARVRELESALAETKQVAAIA